VFVLETIPTDEIDRLCPRKPCIREGLPVAHLAIPLIVAVVVYFDMMIKVKKDHVGMRHSQIAADAMPALEPAHRKLVTPSAFLQLRLALGHFGVSLHFIFQISSRPIFVGGLLTASITRQGAGPSFARRFCISVASLFQLLPCPAQSRWVLRGRKSNAQCKNGVVIL